MAWTSIDADTSWQELAIAQEIATAYNKRVAALSETERTAEGVDEITPSDTMTVFDFVLAVQTGIEAMANRFSDPEIDVEDFADPYFSAPSDLYVYADAQGLFDAAGLTGTGGWRRVAEGDAAPNPWTEYGDSGWGYGKIQDKDLAGPWLFKDLQAALSKLCRRISVPDPIYFCMDAFEGVTNYGAPPAWPTLPSPSYARADYAQPHSGTYNDGQYFIFAADGVSSRSLDVYAKYTDITGSNIISGNVSLKDIRMWAWVSGNPYEGEPDTDFGTGLTLNRFNKLAEKVETTDVTISARTLPELESWGSIVGAVAMPGSGSDVIYQMNVGYQLVDVVYRWDP